MIDIKNLVENVDRYKHELEIRGKDPHLAEEAKNIYELWKNEQSKLDTLNQEKNEFNKKVVNLSGDEKEQAISEMKSVSEKIKNQEDTVKDFKKKLENAVAQVPNLTWDDVPVGKDDSDNPVVEECGDKPEFDFQPKPYYELEVFKKYVDQEAGAKVMGSRGYYMKGAMAKFQKILFNWAEEVIWGHDFEPFYVPLMLNEQTMTEIGNLPDFDGQLYQVPINETTNYYLIPSSEQPLMSYYANKNVGDLEKPILVMANTSCFRKESGSYGKDQQGILRVHQFEKIEIDAICTKEQNDEVFELFAKVNKEIYDTLGIHYRTVEVCSGDMPGKHYRQQDFEAWFPGTENYREICSNGSASDYQNRGLNTTYTNEKGEKEYPWGLNCTGITFRTGLAIMEQFQTADGRVKLPKVIADRFGKEYLE